MVHARLDWLHRTLFSRAVALLLIYNLVFVYASEYLNNLQ